MMRNIISTLFTAALACSALACGGQESDLETADQAATTDSRTKGGDDRTIVPPPSDDGTADYLTCWCNTEQGSNDGSGCYFAITGGSCAGECECGAICGELED